MTTAPAPLCLRNSCNNPTTSASGYCYAHPGGGPQAAGSDASTKARSASVSVAPALTPPPAPEKAHVRPTGYPETATFDQMAALVDGYTNTDDDSIYDGIHEAEFRMELVDVRDFAYATSALDYEIEAESVDEDEGDVDWENAPSYYDLEAAIEADQEIPPLVIYRSQKLADPDSDLSGTHRGERILDGYHRSALALSIGRTHLWAYVGRNPLDQQ